MSESMRRVMRNRKEGAARKRHAGLTLEQVDFCRRYVEHGNAARAYRESHPDKVEGENKVTEWTIRKNALRLLKRPAAIRCIQDIQFEWRHMNAFSPEIHFSNLDELKMEAVAAGQLSVALKAEELKGKAAGFYIERHVNLNANVDVDEEQATEMLKSLLTENPDLIQPLLPQLRELDQKLVESINKGYENAKVGSKVVKSGGLDD